MKQRFSYQLVVPVLLIVFLIGALGLVLPQLIAMPVYQLGPVASTGSVRTMGADTFDSALAGELSGMRWQAMGEHYSRISPILNSAVAGELSGLRWNAKAKAYQQLVPEKHMDAGELSGLRWNAKSKAYQQD